MEKKFKKIMSVLGSVFLIGSTISFAGAMANTMSPFVVNGNSDYAIVTGNGAATSDVIGANSIRDYLNTFLLKNDSTVIDRNITGDFSESSGEKKEITLGDSITPVIRETLLNNRIPSLLNDKFSWNDGTGSNTYYFHEEIITNPDKVQILTNLDQERLEDLVVLTNDKGIEYRFVFDTELKTSKIGSENAGHLYLTLLGKEYEILKLSESSITISISEEKVVEKGSVININGETISIGDIFENILEVEGTFIRKGGKKTIKGVEVYVDQIAYHSSAGSVSKAIIKIGQSIEKQINDGDEYLNKEENWKWVINKPGTYKGSIGVKYDLSSTGYNKNRPERNAISSGGGYVFPENYAALIFDGLTSENYEDFELYFDEKDLYNNTEVEEDVNVVILKGENENSITLLKDNIMLETDTLYLRYINEITNGDETTSAKCEVYFKDIKGDIDQDNKGRIQYVQDINESNSGITLIVGDTEINVNFEDSEDSEKRIIFTTKGNLGEKIEISLGLNEDEDFDRLGKNKEDAEKDEIIVGGKSIGVRKDSVLTHYGIIVNEPEKNSDSDKVILSIPENQVKSKVSFLGKGKEIVDVDSPNIEVGTKVFMDTEIESIKNKNLILVGGSCINTESARLLGGNACGSDFTAKTGIGVGQYLIQSFVSSYNGEKIALVVAGYEAADTSRGVTNLITGDLNLDVGKVYKG